MKKFIALLLMAALLLSGCAKAEAPAPTQTIATEAPTETTEAPTTEPTTVPTEPEVYFNPLNGEILEEPFTGRIFANTISNIPDALPHVGVNQADILMEMLVNNSIIRCLALYTDISDVEAIGSTRSTRLMFNDITQHYDAILSHANGSSLVMNDAKDRGIDNINIDGWANINEYGVSYRDKEYKRGLEHSLFGVGSGIMACAEANGMELTREPGKDYGLTFTEDGTPADGETADKISVTITYKNTRKETIMEYDPSLGKYVYYQYGEMMADQITGETEAFTNVIVMYADISLEPTKNMYYQADFLAGGTGYFACGGKLIPITWSCDSEDSPFRFFTEDGEPLDLGMGNTYIAIAHPDSPVTWEAVEVQETVEETTGEAAG